MFTPSVLSVITDVVSPRIDLIFRRDLFYPLNYETPMHLCAHRFFVTIAKVTFFFVYLAFYG